MWETQKVEVNGEKEAVWGGGTFASAPLSTDLTTPCQTLHVLQHTSEPRRCVYAQLKPHWRSVTKRSACQEWCRSINESEEKVWEGLPLSFLLFLSALDLCDGFS